MRPCPNCECFVPEAARRCPRCDATLEPVPEPAPARRESVLVGMAGHAATAGDGSGRSANGNGNGHAPTRDGDASVSSVVARLTLPPIDGPAGRPRRSQLPKLPQPDAPDPLVLAVVLGIAPAETDAAPASEPVPEETAPAATAPAGTAPASTPNGESFAALLGTPPAAAALTAPPTSSTTPDVAVAPVAVPILPPSPDPAAPRTVRRSRFTQRDPFVRTTTRRERVLTRLCITLAVALALSVIVLRLPLGPRPELGASGPSVSAPAVGPPAVATAPSPSAGSAQTHTDLQKVVTTARQLQHQWHTYALANPTLLGRSLPNLRFIARTAISKQVGEISVATSMHVFVVAEYAGPGLCTFARVVDRHTATIVGPTNAACSAAVTPLTGWLKLPS